MKKQNKKKERTRTKRKEKEGEEERGKEGRGERGRERRRREWDYSQKNLTVSILDFRDILRCLSTCYWLQLRHSWPRQYRDLSCHRPAIVLSFEINRFNSTAHIRNRLIERVDIASVIAFDSFLSGDILSRRLQKRTTGHIFLQQTNRSKLNRGE